MMGNILNKLIFCFFGNEYITEPFEEEEIEPLITRSYFHNQLTDNRGEVLEIIDSKITKIYRDINKVEEQVKNTQLDEEELSISVSNTYEKVYRLEETIEDLETRLKSLEENDLTKKLKELFKE